MSTATPLPVPLDDAALLKLAATPRERLFPVLNRASSFAPLIMVCCVLPAFQLLARPTLNEEASLWGLRSLAVANAGSVIEAIEPGLNETGQPLIFQPPLAAWLNGAVVKVLGPVHPLSTSLVSIVTIGIAIWLSTRLAWRIGGANTALVAALFLCSHPQVLEMSITPTNSSIGFCLLLASVFGVQRHLEGRSPFISASLIISGITWGLSVLTVGPIALSVPAIFVLHGLTQKSALPAEGADQDFQQRPVPCATILRSTGIFVTIGLVISGWWEVLMLVGHGSAFWGSWWSSLPVECLAQGNSEWHCDLRPLVQPSWRDWFGQQALLVGWVIIGFERAWHEWRTPSSELARRRYQLLLYWWLLTAACRGVAEMIGLVTVSNTLMWNVALLTPTVLLAAVGIGTLIERGVTRRGEYFLIVLLVSMTVWRVTGSWLTGITAAALTATFLICGPMLIRSPARPGNTWSEETWRQLLQVAVYGALLATLSAGLGLRSAATPDGERLVDLRGRLTAFPEVNRISLIATRDPIPVTLRHLLRCRWPLADLVTCEGWDAGLTEAMNREAATPRSQFLVLEWTLRDLRLSAETGPRWRISSLGNPMRFHSRRLSFVLIGPGT